MSELTKKFGQNWHLEPPPQARTVLIEGHLDLADFTTAIPMTVCQYLSSSTSEGSVFCVQFIETRFYEYTNLGVYIELPPMAMSGRYTWAAQIATANLSHNSQFPLNDGYFDNTVNPLNRNVLDGISEARRVHLSHSPIIVPSGNDFRIVLRPQINANGQPPADGSIQGFSAFVQGFSLSLQ